MRRLRLFIASGITTLLTILPASRAQDAAAAAQESFADRVQPVIFKHCSGCHTSGGHAGGLTMDSYASFLRGGGGGPPPGTPVPAARRPPQALQYRRPPPLPPRGETHRAGFPPPATSLRDKP